METGKILGVWCKRMVIETDVVMRTVKKALRGKV